MGKPWPIGYMWPNKPQLIALDYFMKAAFVCHYKVLKHIFGSAALVLFACVDFNQT